MNVKTSSLKLLVTGFALSTVAASSLAYGPTSTLYAVNTLEFGANNGLDRVQGASLNNGSTGNNNDYGLAVWGDVRTVGYFGGAVGSQFALNGSSLPGGPYQDTYAADPIYDGTSDGKYNYGVGYFGGQVIQYDRNWANPIVLFQDTKFFQYHSGITMNAVDGSFWLSQYQGGDLVEHYSHTGTLLSTFNSGLFGVHGLALDPIDGTLWMNDGNQINSLYQFDQSGNFLQQATYVQNGRGWYGMEFNGSIVPEPASMTMLVLGSVSLMRRRSRSKGLAS